MVTRRTTALDGLTSQRLSPDFTEWPTHTELQTVDLFAVLNCDTDPAISRVQRIGCNERFGVGNTLDSGDSFLVDPLLN